jgi:recombination protein RecA
VGRPKKKEKEDTKDTSVLAFDAVLDAIQREYGKDAVFYLNDAKKIDVEVISTGSLTLDFATGVGGFPRGRIIEVRGQPSSGKTTLLLSVIANANKNGERAVILDTEHALDIRYAKKLGVDPNLTLISQPNSAEQALNIMHDFMASGQVAIVGLDSIAGLVSEEERIKKIGDPSVMKVAALMSTALKKMEIVASQTRTIGIFTNQFRATMGYGNVGTGGNAIKYDTSIRIDLKEKNKLEVAGRVIGITTIAKLHKNKVHFPYTQAEMIIMFGKGISKIDEIINLSTEYKLVDKAGTWYSYKGTQIGQGRESVRSWLLENPEIFDNLEVGIRELLKSEEMD